MLIAAGSSAATNVYLGYGVSQSNWHGQAFFHSVTFERSGLAPPLIVTSRFPNLRAGVSLSYSDVRQPRSWFGHTYGDPDDRVRAEWAYAFLRRSWKTTFVDFGTGPMWSNRRIPAATSRFNFHTQLGFGASFGRLSLIYRFSHISNGELARRNPGWNVHSLLAGTRIGGR